MKPEQIRKELQQIVTEMEQLLDQKSIIQVDEITIKFGNAPEFGESFGVTREEKQLIFANWLNMLKSKPMQEYFWKGLIIREALLFFIDKKYFLNDFKQLTNFFLNIFTCAYVNNSITGIAKTKILKNFKIRFLSPDKKESEKIEIENNKIKQLIEMVLQKNLPLQDIFFTYFHFIDETPLEGSNLNQILSKIEQNLSNPVEKIAAPIFMEKKLLDIIEELIYNGFKTSTTDLAKKFGVNQSTISRHLTEIRNTFTVRWRKQINWKKLALQLYTIYITISKKENKKIEGIILEFSKEKFIDSIYSGEGKNGMYIYFLIACPKLICENIKNKLNRMMKTEQILSYKVSEVQNYEYYLSFIQTPFEPTIKNFELLLNQQMEIRKIKTFSLEQFEDTEPYQFSKKEYNLLQFLAILKQKTIRSFSNFGLWIPDLNELLKRNNIQPSNKKGILSFLNKLQNEAIEKNLLIYRFWMIPQIEFSSLLHIEISNNNDEEKVKKIIETLTLFNSTLFINTKDERIIIITGPSLKSNFTELILKYLNHQKVDYDFCVLQSIMNRFIPFADILDYSSKKWLIF